MDRQLIVTWRSSGVCQLEGVAYVADTPNVNGVIYPKSVLEAAAHKFCLEAFRPLILPFRFPRQASDIVGSITQVKFYSDDGVLRLVAETVASYRDKISSFLEACSNKVAFAGAGVCTHFLRENTVTGEFTIQDIGLVPLRTVAPK